MRQMSLALLEFVIRPNCWLILEPATWLWLPMLLCWLRVWPFPSPLPGSYALQIDLVRAKPLVQEPVWVLVRERR